jgi:hypothetical protein
MRSATTMGSIIINYELQPNGQYTAGLQVPHGMNAQLALMLIESQALLIYKAYDAKAKSEGYRSAKETPKGWRNNIRLDEILEMQQQEGGI